MTFADIVYRFKKLWWVLVLVIIVTVALIYPKVSKDNYITSVNMGLQYNSSQLPLTEDLVEGYTTSLESFSLFLTNRFTSPEVQQIVAQEMGITVAIDPVVAFYTVTNQGGGFVSVSHLVGTKDEADSFLRGVKKAYTTVTTEWNSVRLEAFKTTPQTTFVENTTVQEASVQIKVLPLITGLLVGLLLILLIPLKSSKS